MGSSGGSSGQTVTQQTQNSEPWSGAQPYINQALSSAQSNFENNIGYQPYTGQIIPDVSPNLNSGLGYNASVAHSQLGGSPLLQAGRGLAQSQISSSGITPGIQNSLAQMQGTYGNLGNVYNEASGQQNPYLLAQIAANDRRIGDKVNSGMSGAGRYGSGQHTDVLSRSLAEAANPVLAQDYSQRQQTRLAALAGQQGVSGNMADIYGQGLQRAGQWAQLSPTLDQAQYAPGDVEMGIGQWYMDRQKEDLAQQAATYNAYQSLPWEQLARYNAIIGGSGGLGGSKVGTSTTTPAQVPLSSKIFGGAIAGAGLGSSFGGVPGAGIGALGGGLLGML